MALINAIFTIVQLTGFTDNDVNTYISSQMFEKNGKDLLVFLGARLEQFPCGAADDRLGFPGL